MITECQFLERSMIVNFGNNHGSRLTYQPTFCLQLKNNLLFLNCNLLCAPPGRRLRTAVGAERERPGGGHSIFVLPHDLPISGLEIKHF